MFYISHCFIVHISNFVWFYSTLTFCWPELSKDAIRDKSLFCTYQTTTRPISRSSELWRHFLFFSHIIFKYVGFLSCKKKAQKPGNNMLLLFFVSSQKMDCKPQNPPPPGSLVGSQSSLEYKGVPRSAPPSPAPSNRACLLSS